MARRYRKHKPELDKSPLVDELPRACCGEAAAREFLERQRWGGQPCCPHCGDVDVYRMSGASAVRRGLLRCHGCKKQFTVRVGTIFEDSAVALHKWCRAFWEAAACKAGVSSLELSRKIQVTQKTALFMLHRIRFAMADDPASPPKLRGVVEADETYIGGKPRYRGTMPCGRSNTAKTPVLALIERQGEVRASVVSDVTSRTIRAEIEAAVDPSASRLCTDEWRSYILIGRKFAGGHAVVRHQSRQYVNGDAYTNTAESFFARCKRSLNGVYHAVSRAQLHRYVAQWQFAHNTRELNDGQRTAALIRKTAGKRLTYRKSA